jgi:hypothetical protein
VLPPKKQITDFSSPTKKQKGQATAKADPCVMTTNRTGKNKNTDFSAACEAVILRNNYDRGFWSDSQTPFAGRA